MKTRRHTRQADSALTCELCDREVERLTNHHLVPRMKGGKYGPQARLCPTCHRQVHALFSEGTLAKSLNSIEALKADPQVGKLSLMGQEAGGGAPNSGCAGGRVDIKDGQARNLPILK